MILYEYLTRHKSRSDEYVLYPIGDTHVGAAAFDRDALRDTVREIEKSDNALWIGMGDYSECINLSDKRFDLKSVDPKFVPRLDDIANACFEELAGLFEPIRGKCIGLLVGNHEETLRIRHSQDVHASLCLRLGLPNLGYDSLIRWKFERKGNGTERPSSQVLSIFASHGTIAGRKDGAKINRMVEVSQNFDADLYLFGHGHAQIAARSVQLRLPEQGDLKLRERLRLVCMTGTYRRSYHVGTRDYSEKSHHAPPPIGCPKITVRPWAEPRRRFEVRIG